MEWLDYRVCYACSDRIGLLRLALRPVEATFESAFDGPVRAAFCSTRCKEDAIANAAAVRKSFPPPAMPPPDVRNFTVTER